jgi:glycosyltransferase involved in cell wall biosynthesis
MRAAFAVPGSLDTPTGGYIYDKRIVEELRALGWQIDVIDLGPSFPEADAAARKAALDKLLAVPQACPIIIDGLAFGAMDEEAALLRDRNPLVALVHHPLALETGISEQATLALQMSERDALAFARAVIVTSEPTAKILRRDYDVPPSRIMVARPGVDRVAVAARPASGGPIIELLAVGSVTPRKGYDLLLAALAQLEDLPWRLTIAGDTTRDAAALARLEVDLARFKLRERVTLTGAVSRERLMELYTSADAFVLASLYEGYGMVFSEAIAHGLPIVATTVGAAVEVVGAEAGVLVPPSDENALRHALRRVIEDSELRGWMAAAARQLAHGLPQWRQSALIFADVLGKLI